METKQVDETILQELLSTPEVKKDIEGLSPEAVAWYRDLLVSEGIYDQYVQAREKMEA